MCVCHLLNIKMHAISRSIQNKLSIGITSVPLKYSPNGIGQHSVKFIKPIIVNANAIIGTGGSPITFRNITCHQLKKNCMNQPLSYRLKCVKLTLNTAYAAPEIVAKTTPPNVGLPVMPSI